MGTDQPAADVAYAEVADTRLDIDHSRVWDTNKEIDITDLVFALVIPDDVYYYRPAQILRYDCGCRCLHRGRNAYIRAVPTLNNDRAGPVHQLKADILARRIHPRKPFLRGHLANKKRQEKNYAQKDRSFTDWRSAKLVF
jgi:hypothetical protein